MFKCILRYINNKNKQIWLMIVKGTTNQPATQLYPIPTQSNPSVVNCCYIVVVGVPCMAVNHPTLLLAINKILRYNNQSILPLASILVGTKNYIWYRILEIHVVVLVCVNTKISLMVFKAKYP